MKIIDIDSKYEIDYKNNLGKGFSSIVYSAKNKVTKKEVAIKRIDLSMERTSENEILNEYNIMKNISSHCENSVKLLDFLRDEKYYYLIMEKCESNLEILINDSKNGLDIKTIKNIMNQFNKTMKYMIDNHIIHRDIKPLNLLLKTEKDSFKVKLCDYGFSKYIEEVSSSDLGTIIYKAPLLYKSDKDEKFKCDLWSIGIMLYKMYFKILPFKKLQIYTDLMKNKNIEIENLKLIKDNSLKDLISKLIVVDYKKRIDWKDYFNHNFFKNIEDNILDIELEIQIFDKDKKDKDCEEFEKANINKEIMILYEEDFTVLNKNNTKLYLNNKEIPFSSKIIINKIGTHKIQIKSKVKLISLSNMFKDCYYINNIIFNKINTSNVIDMSGMFLNCKNLTNLDLSLFTTSNVTNMENMFSYCFKLKNINLSSFETINVKNLNRMFYYCELLSKLDLSSFKLKNAINMKEIFSNCSNLSDLKLFSIISDEVKDMSEMFSYCNKLNNLDLSKFKTKNVTNMYQMFYYCENLTNLDLSYFETLNVLDMSDMFSYCSNLSILNLSSFKLNNEVNIKDIVFSCDSLKKVKVNKEMLTKFSKEINKNLLEC